MEICMQHFFFLHSLNTPYLWAFLKLIFFFFVRHCLDTHGYLDFSLVPMKVKLKDKYHWAIVTFRNVKFDLDLVQLKYMLSTFRWRDHGMENSQLEIWKLENDHQFYFQTDGNAIFLLDFESALLESINKWRWCGK